MLKKWVWQARPWEAFKTFAILFSFTMNVVLLLVLLLVAPLILPIVNDIANPIVGGLSDSFVAMGDAHIVQTIQVDDEMPINFNLPLSTGTVVTLTEDVPLVLNARFVLPDGGGVINGAVSLQLPQNLELPVNLSLNVPVSQTIPVQLNVPVDIAMNETELGAPFQTLQQLFQPLEALLGGLPRNTEDLMNRFSGAAAARSDGETAVNSGGSAAAVGD